MAAGKNEKKTLKILFWCLSPLFFIAFLRLFWVIIGFFFGGLFYLVFGARPAGPMAVLSAATALVITVLTLWWLYRQFKTHII
ncbi:MAG: hypothetical protein ACLFPD_01495 [Desulfosudaceae bacterium]